jgi:hypothetical protein
MLCVNMVVVASRPLVVDDHRRSYRLVSSLVNSLPDTLLYAMLEMETFFQDGVPVRVVDKHAFPSTQPRGGNDMQDKECEGGGMKMR